MTYLAGLVANNVSNRLMKKAFRHKLIKTLQRVFWVYFTDNFIVRSPNDFNQFEHQMKFRFIPITLDTYHRVGDFREDYRISEYRDKLTRKEIGYFAEHEGKVIGSIWGTINKAKTPIIARTYMKLMPNEGLIHDIVTGEKFRGMGVASFMVRSITSVLLGEHGSSRIIIDVNTRNRPSLRMLKSIGLRVDHRMIAVSAFGTLLFKLTLKVDGRQVAA